MRRAMFTSSNRRRRRRGVAFGSSTGWTSYHPRGRRPLCRNTSGTPTSLTTKRYIHIYHISFHIYHIYISYIYIYTYLWITIYSRGKRPLCRNTWGTPTSLTTKRYINIYHILFHIYPIYISYRDIYIYIRICELLYIVGVNVVQKYLGDPYLINNKNLYIDINTIYIIYIIYIYL